MNIPDDSVYVTKPRRAHTCVYDGTNVMEVMAFAGEENVDLVEDGHLRVRGSGGVWKDFVPGDRVIKDLSDGWMHPASPETFSRVWEQET